MIRVAVLYFAYNGQDPRLQPLNVGLAEMLIGDLVGQPGLIVVERGQLQAVLDELDLGRSGYADAASAVQVGGLLNADYLIVGNYEETSNGLRIDASIVQTRTSAIVGHYGAFDKAKRFVALEEEVAGWARDVLARQEPSGTVGAIPPVDPVGGGERSERRASGVTKPDPQALDAAIAFSEGLVALDARDLVRAREAFERAVTDDPALEEAKAALADLEL